MKKIMFLMAVLCLVAAIFAVPSFAQDFKNAAGAYTAFSNTTINVNVNPYARIRVANEDLNKTINIIAGDKGSYVMVPFSVKVNFNYKVDAAFAPADASPFVWSWGIAPDAVAAKRKTTDDGIVSPDLPKFVTGASNMDIDTPYCVVVGAQYFTVGAEATADAGVYDNAGVLTLTISAQQ